MEVGTQGLLTLMTALRALGPRADGICLCATFTSRPTDGRYGEANHLQHYYQFKWWLNRLQITFRTLFGSLEMLGFDPTQNDIRFVEDNWENQP